MTKKKRKHPHIDKSPVRKRKAKTWVKTHAGTDIVKDYRAHFPGVDVACALRELQEIGYEFEPGYVENVIGAESERINQIRENKEAKQGKDGDEVISQPVKKAGKNHIKVDGQLLQTNKKWSHLSEKQKNWIYETAKIEYNKFLEANNRLPEKAGKVKLMAVIEDKISERGIWIPSRELDSALSKYIARLNRRTRKIFQVDGHGFIVVTDDAGNDKVLEI